MAKDLYVPVTLRGNRLEAKVQLGQTVIVTEGPEEYTGPVTVTPSESEQVLQTADKMLTDNVTVNPIPSEYIIPTGSMSITENGSYDVTEKASVTVDVPAPVPTGTIEITENGTYDVAQMATALVNVSAPQNVVTGSFTGNGGLSVSIPCDFDPDIVYIFSPNRLDDYTVSSGGVTWAILITAIVCITIRKTPTTNTAASGFLLPVANNKPGKVYDNGTLTIYVPGSNVYKFADGETYNYVLVKLSE